MKKCLPCHICFFLTNSVLITTGDRTAPWTSTAPNRTSRLAPRITDNRGCEQSINIPEPHPCRSPGRWFLWALWRSSRLCRSSGYRSHPQAGSGGNTSSWRTEAESRNGICRNKKSTFIYFFHPTDAHIYHPLFTIITLWECSHSNSVIRILLISGANRSLCISPSWWRWWHCSCCLYTASHACRCHLSGIPGRLYPVTDRKKIDGLHHLQPWLTFCTHREGKTYRCANRVKL